jgi:hypothetical protein
MREVDVVVLTRLVAELKPAQRFTDHTPDMWAKVLADVPATLEEATEAAIRVARRSTWIDPGELRHEIRKALPPSRLQKPAEVRRREIDWSPEATEARRETAARAKAEALEEIARRGFKPVRSIKDSAVATNPRIAAALERHRADQAAGDAGNPVPDTAPADGGLVAVESVKNLVSQFRKATDS